MFLSHPGIHQSLLNISLQGSKNTEVYPHDPEVIPKESLAPSLITDSDSQPEHGED